MRILAQGRRKYSDVILSGHWSQKSNQFSYTEGTLLVGYAQENFTVTITKSRAKSIESDREALSNSEWQNFLNHLKMSEHLISISSKFLETATPQFICQSFSIYSSFHSVSNPPHAYINLVSAVLPDNSFDENEIQQILFPYLKSIDF